MPVHDWTLVEAGIFHDFHTVWIGQLRSTLNEGLLPNGYYALTEQHYGRKIADLLTLHTGPGPSEPPAPFAAPATGGQAVAEAPPRTRRKQTLDLSQVRRRSLAVRHVSGHRLVALVEIVSPANKDRPGSIEEFTGKILSALDNGVNVLLVDLFPPGRHDPDGLHGVMPRDVESTDDHYELPPGEPLTFASYVAGPPVEVYLEHGAVGAPLPEMPLFLHRDRYINVPLELTYLATYRGVPAFWRQVLEAPPPAQ